MDVTSILVAASVLFAALPPTFMLWRIATALRKKEPPKETAPSSFQVEVQIKGKSTVLFTLWMLPPDQRHILQIDPSKLKDVE